MLQKLRPANLTHLALPKTSSDLTDVFPLKDLDTTLPNLRGLTIHTAWNNVPHVHGLKPAGFEMLQVFLAEPPTRHPGLIGWRVKDFLSGKLFGANVKFDCVWRNEVEHIRCDHIHIDTLEIDRIDQEETALQNLKVLVLRPGAQVQRGHRYWTLDFPALHTWTAWDPSGRNELARKRAKKIAEQKLHSLRFIAVHNHHFWVEHKIHTKMERAIKTQKLWWLAEALGDDEQRAEIGRVMDDRDWAFLTNVELIVPIDLEGRGAAGGDYGSVQNGILSHWDGPVIGR